MKRSMTTLMLALTALNCGGGNDGTTNASDDDAGANTAADGAGSTTHADAACTPSGTTDDPDDNGVDANCDGADGVVGVDVYVDVAAGADTNAGTPSEPMRTIGAAITLAAKTKGRVMMTSGTYPVDSLTISAEAHVFGGYPATFVGTPKRALTTLQASDKGLLVDVKTNKLSFAHVTIRGADASAAQQASAYGLRIASGDVSLDDVEVDAGDGVTGANGAPGLPGSSIVNTNGVLSCEGVTQPTYVHGASAGARSAEGHAPGDLTNKVAAASASVGAPGSDGSDAVAQVTLSDGLLVASSGTPGKSDGTAGFGGAGGGLGRVASGSYAGVSLGYTGGAGGAGGCPGKGGAGGVSGGSSIAVLVLAGSVHVTRSHLHTGLGGAGGDGGQGGAGSAGAPGAMPMPQGSVAWFQSPTTCTSVNASSDPLLANCAGYGGSGGDGGPGGSGGGGAGGWTIGIATSAGASAQVDGATDYDLGRGGNGGTGHGGGRAPSGKSVRGYAMP